MWTYSNSSRARPRPGALIELQNPSLRITLAGAIEISRLGLTPQPPMVNMVNPVNVENVLHMVKMVDMLLVSSWRKSMNSQRKTMTSWRTSMDSFRKSLMSLANHSFPSTGPVDQWSSGLCRGLCRGTSVSTDLVLCFPLKPCRQAHERLNMVLKALSPKTMTF